MSKFKISNWLPILSSKHPVRRLLFLSYFPWEMFLNFYLKQQEIVEYLDTSYLTIFASSDWTPLCRNAAVTDEGPESTNLEKLCRSSPF